MNLHVITKTKKEINVMETSLKAVIISVCVSVHESLSPRASIRKATVNMPPGHSLRSISPSPSGQRSPSALPGPLTACVSREAEGRRPGTMGVSTRHPVPSSPAGGGCSWEADFIEAPPWVTAPSPRSLPTHAESWPGTFVLGVSGASCAERLDSCPSMFLGPQAGRQEGGLPPRPLTWAREQTAPCVPLQEKCPKSWEGMWDKRPGRDWAPGWGVAGTRGLAMGRWCLGCSSEGRGGSGGRQLCTATPGTHPPHSRNKLWAAKRRMFSEEHPPTLIVGVWGSGRARC